MRGGGGEEGGEHREEDRGGRGSRLIRPRRRAASQASGQAGRQQPSSSYTEPQGSAPWLPRGWLGFPGARSRGGRCCRGPPPRSVPDAGEPGLPLAEGLGRRARAHLLAALLLRRVGIGGFSCRQAGTLLHVVALDRPVGRLRRRFWLQFGHSLSGVRDEEGSIFMRESRGCQRWLSSQRRV
jgi:hypothetical protein